MDVTTVQCGKDTRNELREYRDKHDLQNYDEAIRDLLESHE